MPTANYGNKWDDIVTRFIKQREPADGYWQESEQRALGIAKTCAASKPNARMLDLGCGTGRLLTFFAGIVREIVAMEPDEERLAIARKAGANLHNVAYISESFQDYSGKKFDIVLCSHVIQHLESKALPGFVEKLRCVLEEDGRLILLTAHSETRDDAYKVWQPSDTSARIIETRLSTQAEFDLLLRSSPEYCVPTHAFSSGSLRNLFSRFRLGEVRYFHSLHKWNFADEIIFRDTWMNFPSVRGRYGIDVLAIGRNTHPG